MRPFPVKTPIGTVSKITPSFIGFNRGITPTEVTRTQHKPTSQAELKVLRSPQANTIPLININDRYQYVNVNFTRGASAKRPPPIIPRPKPKGKVTMSTYNFE